MDGPGSRRDAEGAERRAATTERLPRISLIARMKNDGFPVREFREIRDDNLPERK
jgi:hypothetical protein